MMNWHDVGMVLLLSLVAGLGTGLGGLIAILRRPGRRSFGLLMGIAAGVMITLSFMELVNEAWELAGFLTATIGFAAGAIFMFVIDFFIPHIRFGEVEAETPGKAVPIPKRCCEEEAAYIVVPVQTAGMAQQTVSYPGGESPAIQAAAATAGQPDYQNPGIPYPGDGRFAHKQQPWHERRFQRRFGAGQKSRRFAQARRNHISDYRLLKTGVLIAVGITIHNIPEGIAVGAGYMHLPEFGVFIALAILLHNIPEGIAVAMPLCKSGVCRWDSFRAALFSGLAEPIGALVAVFFLATFEALIPAALAFAGGVMVFITLDELVPAAREHGHQHYTAIGIILGAIFVFLLSGLFGV